MNEKARNFNEITALQTERDHAHTNKSDIGG